jgi:hypothetical protein
MPIFKIQKYDQDAKETNAVEQPEKDDKEKKEVYIKVDGTISELVAKALYKLKQLSNKELEVSEVPKEQEPKEVDVDVVTSETIKEDPLKAFRRVSSSKTMCYYSTEEIISPKVSWLIYNTRESGKKIMYSTESLVSHVLNLFED